MNRRTFLRSTAATSAIFLSRPLSFAEQESVAAVDDSSIDERIQRHRRGELNLVVRDSRGKPLQNAAVSVQQVRHEFLFGCNFFMFDRCGRADLEESYRAHFADLLNYATLGFYWRNYEAQRGAPMYDYTDRVLEWTRERGITCKGHPLVWDHPAGSPRWLPQDHQEIRRLSNRRVADIVKRFAGRIDMWDVVNEAVHLPEKKNDTTMAEWALAEGPVPYVAQHLRIAGETNPKATLLVNDYRLDPPYERLLRALQAAKEPFHCIGLQSHMHGGPWANKRVWDICNTYAALGLPLHFTEMTVVSGPRTGPGENWGETTPEGEENQAQAVERLYKLLFSHPAVEAITWWDFSDLGAWQRAAAGWLRKDMTPKPAYLRLQALIRKAWWTRAEGATGAEGLWSTRAFYGHYRAEVRLPNGLSRTRFLDFSRKADKVFEISI